MRAPEAGRNGGGTFTGMNVSVIRMVVTRASVETVRIALPRSSQTVITTGYSSASGAG